MSSSAPVAATACRRCARAAARPTPLSSNGSEEPRRRAPVVARVSCVLAVKRGERLAAERFRVAAGRGSGELDRPDLRDHRGTPPPSPRSPRRRRSSAKGSGEPAEPSRRPRVVRLPGVIPGATMRKALITTLGLAATAATTVPVLAATAPVDAGRTAAISVTTKLPSGDTLTLEISASQLNAGPRLVTHTVRCDADRNCVTQPYAADLP